MASTSATQARVYAWVCYRARDRLTIIWFAVFEPKPLFILLANESLARPRGRGGGTARKRTGAGGEPGCFVLNNKIGAGGAARGVIRDGARGATCAGAVRLHRAAARSESLHLLEHLRQTFYKCQGLPALVQPLLAK